MPHAPVVGALVILVAYGFVFFSHGPRKEAREERLASNRASSELVVPAPETDAATLAASTSGEEVLAGASSDAREAFPLLPTPEETASESPNAASPEPLAIANSGEMTTQPEAASDEPVMAIQVAPQSVAPAVVEPPKQEKLLSMAGTPRRTATDLDEEELNTILMNRFSAERAKATDEKQWWSNSRRSTFKGSFTLKTSLEWNPEVKVIYRVPLNVQKRPTPDASNVVLYCTWPGGAAPYKGPLEAPLHGHMAGFSDHLGFTVFSLEIVTRQGEMGNKREAYFYGGPDWLDVVTRAQEEIIRRHKLKSKKLLVYGPSLGATFAQRVAVGLGEKVGGVAIQNAPEVTLPTEHTGTAWYVAVTRGDGGSQANKELAKTLRNLGTACIFSVTPPAYAARGTMTDAAFYHSVSGEAHNAALLFLQGVVTQQDRAGENDPVRWPYVRDADRPLLIMENNRVAQEKIPERRREHLPSAKLVRLLEGLPAPTQTAMLASGTGKNSACLIGLPPLGKPKGVVVVTHKYGFNDLPQLLNNLNFIAQQGYLVLVPKLRTKPEEEVRATLELIARASATAKLPTAFISVGEVNAQLWKFAIAERAFRPAAYVPINFEPGSMLDESQWPLGKRLEWPLLFLYDLKEFATVTSISAANEAEAKLKKVKSFAALQEQRNQVASVRFVPLGQKSNEQSAQKTIETALQFIDASVAGKIRTQF
jgi:pimeloyl-ACP methyl ester carboxylesterase